MNENQYTIEPIGFVRSGLVRLEDAPRQGEEGAPDAWLDLLPALSGGCTGIHVGDELIVLTWLHRSNRSVLQVHPRGNIHAPLTGVFATRSPDRPNPVGLHQVSVPDRWTQITNCADRGNRWNTRCRSQACMATAGNQRVILHRAD